MITEHPLVRHYKAAESDLGAWAALPNGQPVTQSRLDMYVVALLTPGSSFQALDSMTFRQYKPYLDNISEITMPIRMRVKGTGPWEIYECGCCQESCGLICLCPPESCTKGCSLYTQFRELMSHDLHIVAPEGLVDTFRLVEILVGEPIADWEYHKYRVVSAIITRSMNNPLSHRVPGAQLPLLDGMTTSS